MLPIIWGVNMTSIDLMERVRILQEELDDAKNIIRELIIPPPMQDPLIRITAQMRLQGSE